MDFRVVKTVNANSVTHLLGIENWGSCCQISHCTLINSSWARRKEWASNCFKRTQPLTAGLQARQRMRRSGVWRHSAMQKYKTPATFCYHMQAIRRIVKECKKQRHNTEHTIVLWQKIHKICEVWNQTVEVYGKIIMQQAFRQKTEKGKSG